MALYYPLSASLILFANILSNPQAQHQNQHATAASDIHLMNQLTSFIAQSVQPGTSFAATPTLGMFRELYGIATRLVAKVHTSAHVPQSSRKMKNRMPNDERADGHDPDHDPAPQLDFISAGSVVVPNESPHSDMNTQPTISSVSILIYPLQNRPQSFFHPTSSKPSPTSL